MVLDGKTECRYVKTRQIKDEDTGNRKVKTEEVVKSKKRNGR